MIPYNTVSLLASLVQIHFLDDVQEPPIELLHHLRLGLDMHGKPQKRPHVFEMYEELVFWEPTAALYDRVTKNATGAPESSVEQYFGKFDAEADYKLIQAGRKRVAKSMAMLKAKLAAIEAEYFGSTLTVTLLVEFKPAASVALMVTVYEDLVEYVAVTESFNFKEPLTISKEPASVPDSS